jgi:hypothetical protein
VKCFIFNGIPALLRQKNSFRIGPNGRRRSGVIWNIIPYETPVIPAKAGIQSVSSAFPKVCGVDSRFRGNDCGLEPPCLANDTGIDHG